MIVRELVTKLGFRLDDDGAKKAEGAFKKLTSLAKGFVAAYSATKVFQFFNDATAYFDEIDKAVSRLGISSDVLQKLW